MSGQILKQWWLRQKERWVPTTDTQQHRKYIPILRRLKWRCLNWRDRGRWMNNVTTVEQWLYECAAGKRPLPDKQMCRKWARKLGIPDDSGT